MKFSISEFEKVGNVLRKSDVYTVLDVKGLDHLVVSMTILHPGKETGGHSHGDADEVYIVTEGTGKMNIDKDKFDVKKDDIVLVKRGCFHKVFNESDKDLKFLSVFEKYEGRG